MTGEHSLPFRRFCIELTFPCLGDAGASQSETIAEQSPYNYVPTLCICALFIALFGLSGGKSFSTDHRRPADDLSLPSFAPY